MAFNGTGTFSRLYNWVTDQANGILVRADRMDADTDDIASGLSNCITRDGQSPPTADIPMGTKKLTGLGNGTAPQDATTVLQVFTSPNFTEIPTAPTAALGTNTTQIATMAALNAQAFLTALPSQTGNAGKFVTTDGTTASWGVAITPFQIALISQQSYIFNGGL